MLFQNVTLVLPDRLVAGGSLRTNGSRIEAVAAGGEKLEPRDGEEIVDGAGMYLSPGFVDLHVHGAVHRDAMEACDGAFDAILGFHARGGTTAAALTTTAAGTEEIVRVLELARRWRTTQRKAAGGAALLGIHVEGPFFAATRAGVHPAASIRNPTTEETDRLLAFADVVTQMTLAPELPGALDLIARLVEHRIIASGGHSDAWDEDAAAAYVRGMSQVSHTFNAMSGARRRGAFRVAGLLEYALSEPGIHCELIADGRHVSPTLIRMLYRAKGRAGICLVTDATAGAGLPEGATYRLAGRDCVVRDGVGMTADGAALAGSTSMMVDGVRCLVREVGIPLHEAVGMASANPAAALRQENERGRLAAGLRADLVLLIGTLEVAATYVGGDCVHRAERF